MSTPQQHGSAGLGWVTLDDGVAYSRAWLTTNTPGLFAAWGRAQTEQQRQRLVAEIQQVAAAVESAGKRDPREEYVTVPIQWAETTRYEAQLYLDPNSSEDEIWSEIANLPDAQRRTLDVTDEDKPDDQRGRPRRRRDRTCRGMRHRRWQHRRLGRPRRQHRRTDRSGETWLSRRHRTPSADLRSAGRDVAEVATDGLRVTACATEPAATYQTRLEYRDNPNSAWTVLDSWADVAVPSASAAIMTTLKLEQDLGGITTADVQELTPAVILSAARAQPQGAFVDTDGTQQPTAEFDTNEHGHTRARSADEVLSERLSRAVCEIYDTDPDVARLAARNVVLHTPNPDQSAYPFDGYSDAFLLQAIAAVAGDAAAPRVAPTASGQDVTRHGERLVSQIAPPALADPGWAGLAATPSRAAASGWELAGGLQRLVNENLLPDRRPALELQCRVIAECEASMPPPPSVAEINRTSADRGRSRSPTEPPAHRVQQAASIGGDGPRR